MTTKVTYKQFLAAQKKLEKYTKLASAAVRRGDQAALDKLSDMSTSALAVCAAYKDQQASRK